MLKLRTATTNDTLPIFEWRNDDLTRQMSRNPKPVTWETHKKWLASALANKRKLLLIAEILEPNRRKIGMVRFDVNDKETSAEISINLNPLERGAGLSKQILNKSIALFIPLFPTCHKLIAEIKPENIASIHTFVGSDFEKKETNKSCDIYHRNIGQ